MKHGAITERSCQILPLYTTLAPDYAAEFMSHWQFWGEIP
jgi:hypothetical protein